MNRASKIEIMRDWVEGLKQFCKKGKSVFKVSHPTYFKRKRTLRKKVLQFGKAAKLLHFAGINFCVLGKLTFFAVKNSAI